MVSDAAVAGARGDGLVAFGGRFQPGREGRGIDRQRELLVDGERADGLAHLLAVGPGGRRRQVAQLLEAADDGRVGQGGRHVGIVVAALGLGFARGRLGGPAGVGPAGIDHPGDGVGVGDLAGRRGLHRGGGGRADDLVLRLRAGERGRGGPGRLGLVGRRRRARGGVRKRGGLDVAQAGAGAIVLAEGVGNEDAIRDAGGLCLFRRQRAWRAAAIGDVGRQRRQQAAVAEFFLRHFRHVLEAGLTVDRRLDNRHSLPRGFAGDDRFRPGHHPHAVGVAAAKALEHDALALVGADVGDLVAPAGIGAVDAERVGAARDGVEGADADAGTGRGPERLGHVGRRNGQDRLELLIDGAEIARRDRAFLAGGRTGQQPGGEQPDGKWCRTPEAGPKSREGGQECHRLVLLVVSARRAGRAPDALPPPDGRAGAG